MNPLQKLREQMRAQNLAAFLVPRADEHLNEYVPENAERLAWLTGFTGSAGLAIVTRTEAAIWSDGRYVTQLAEQAPSWQRLHLTDNPPAEWLARHLAPGEAAGYDPFLFAEDQLAQYREAGAALIPLARNPLDAAWTDRPGPPLAPALPYPIDYAGMPAAEKRERVAATLREAGHDAAIISDPASIAWLLNIRGDDVPCTPMALGFAILGADGDVSLFMDPRKVPPETQAWLGNHVGVSPKTALPEALSGFAGKKVRVDPANSPAWFAQTLREAGATVTAGADPCLMPKARKNAIEQQGSRAAHSRDALAVCRFLHWMQSHAGAREIEAAETLNGFRAEAQNYRGQSFDAISGAGEHGAIIHYRATPASDRAIGANQVYLIDSGAQYLDGTTDITRTIWTGPDAAPVEIRDRYTRVLKGHIAIATLVFPEGVNGSRLDGFARAALWRAGLDYDHGTGHGVGSYLSVHEGPASLSPRGTAAGIMSGMILSNEPGYYQPGAYGIRLENLVLAKPAELVSDKPFLKFETLSLAPFDRALIEPALLDAAERDWLDAYHARVLASVELPGLAQAWLAHACAALDVRPNEGVLF